MNTENPRPYSRQVFNELHNEQGVLKIDIHLSHKFFVCGFDMYDDSIFTAMGFNNSQEANSFLEGLKATDTREASWGIFDANGFQVDESVSGA